MGDEPEDDASKDPGEGGAERYVLAYLDLVDQGTAPDLNDFLQTVPKALRAEVEADCRRYRSVEGALRASAAPRRDAAVLPTLEGYEVTRLIDEGGMGEVFEARRIEDGRRVAIKILKPRYCDSSEARERFRREATLGHEFEQDGIVPVLDHGEAGGRPYLVMPYVGGGSLQSRIAAAQKSAERAFEATTIARVAIKVLSALESCHARGIIHRDLKPANILLDERDEPWLIDFGLARIEARSQLTRVGTLVGTVAYMSPEQTLLTFRHPIDGRSDLYSLGAVLYTMLTGRPPFGQAEDGSQKEDSEVLRDILFTDPSPPSKIDSRVHKDLETICLKALEKSPQHRYQTAADMRADLERFVRHEAIEARPVLGVVRLARRLARHRLALGVTIGALAVLAGVAISLLVYDPRPRLRIRARPGSLVYLEHFDLAESRHAAPQALGVGPTLAAAVDRGAYRITFEDGPRSFVALDVLVREVDVEVQAPTSRPLEDLLVDMVRFEDDRPFVAGIEANSRSPFLARRTVPALPPFAIDVREVSFGEYRRFLAATGHEVAPSLNDGKPPELEDFPDDKPAVYLGRRDAEAYAAWVGKRLPTRLEWERTARGVDGKRWLVPPPFEEQNIVVDRELQAVQRQSDRGGWARAFVRNTVATKFVNADVTPEGVLHMMGNVSEFVSGYDFSLENDVLWNQALVKGGCWHDASVAAHFDFVGSFPADKVDGACLRGFRCAVSLTPPSQRTSSR